MGAFQRKSYLKHRIIHDLSLPPGESINDFIDVDESSVTYMSVDDITTKLKSYGPGSFMSTLDLADAHKSIRVRPEDWHLLGAVWITDISDKQYYFDQALPFGPRWPQGFGNLPKSRPGLRKIPYTVSSLRSYGCLFLITQLVRVSLKNMRLHLHYPDSAKYGERPTETGPQITYTPT